MAFVGTRNDLAKIRFKMLPGLGYAPRMLLAAAAVGLGVFAQFQTGTVWLVLGSLFVFCGILLTLVDAKTNKPPAVRGEATWDRVTPGEYARILGMVRQGQRWARRDLFGASNLTGFGMFLALGLALAFGYFLIAHVSTERAATVWAIDGGLFLLLTYTVGARRPWQPQDLLIKVEALKRLMDEQADRPIPRLRFQPMLEVTKDKTGRQLPRDARLLVTVEQAPEDLIGFQVQCSLNRVSGTAYPYLYAVIIARKAFNLGQRLGDAAVSAKDVLTFEEADKEVDVAVLRQKTTKTTGYHTKRDDQQRIFDRAARLALALANA